MAILCSECGAESAKDAVTCLSCGAAIQAELQGSIETLPPLAAATATAGTGPIASTIAPPMFATDTDLEGIGGWLIPTVIALALGPLIALRGIYTDLHVLYGSVFQTHLASRPGIALLILFEAATNAIFLIALIGLNVLFYRTRRSFPGWMIAYLIVALCVTLLDHLFTLHFYPAVKWTAVFQRLVGALIWVPYFLQSQRVKQTFVN